VGGRGDLSESLDGRSLRPITVRDPLTGAAFPGNVIPAARIDPNMQKLLNVFPLPNVTPDAAHHFNLQLSDTLERPVYQELLRVDYVVSPKVRAGGRGWHQSVHNKGLASRVNNRGWGVGPVDYPPGGRSVGGNLTWIVNPTLVQEFTAGLSTWDEEHLIDPDVLANLQ